VALPAARPDDADCNGRDDDCDGVVDDDFEDAWVRVGAFEIYAYEASRPGATADVAGLDLVPDDGVQAFVEARSCSRPGVRPWSDVTWAEAEVACRAAGARLCRRDEWTLACGGPEGRPFPYGASYDGGACNGGAHDADPAAPGDQDAPLPAGALAACEAGGVFDLSGNLKEWTDDLVDGQRPVRGGGYASNVPEGLACGQLGDLKPAELRSANIGFRCCRD
jgi:formylglycine-generating enzyme required for sulfatase activity